MIVCRITLIGSFFIQLIKEQLEQSGRIELSVFVCPKYNPDALLGDEPETFVSRKCEEPDLFTPRIPKITSLLNDLKQIGLQTRLYVIVGDTDPEYYVFPTVGVDIDYDRYRERVRSYAESFAIRCERLFGRDCEIVSLSEIGLGEISIPQITDEQMSTEREFFSWLFGKEGPYQGIYNVPTEDVVWMIKKKFELYGAQGWLVSELTGGIILQAETPWLLRTQMLKCTGAKVAAIYPWIRQEELSTIDNE